MKKRAYITSRVAKMGVMAVLFALVDLASYGAAHRFTMTVNYSGAVAADVPTLLRVSPGLIDYSAAGDGTHFKIVDENGARGTQTESRSSGSRCRSSRMGGGSR